MQDFQQLIEEAHARGMVVIIDLVMNHTSSEHPWFLDARQHGDTRRLVYLVGYRSGLWWPLGCSSVWHDIDGRYFYGVFWEGMPDLNYRNPAVTEKCTILSASGCKIWVSDGFRLDAIKHLIEDGDVRKIRRKRTNGWLVSIVLCVPSIRMR